MMNSDAVSGFDVAFWSAAARRRFVIQATWRRDEAKSKVRRI